MPSDDDRDSDDEWGDEADEWGSNADSSPPTDPALSAEASSPPDDPTSFGDRLGDGWDRALDHLPLAAVPLVSSLLAVDNARRVLASERLHFGLAFRFPAALPDLWTFVSLPGREAGVHVSPALAALPVLILVRAALVAGLVGSVHDLLRTGEYDFAANVRRYFAPVVVYEVVVHVAGLAAVAVGIAAFPLAFLLLPAFIVASYLFYAAPYVLVVADCGVADALGRSYAWATDGGPYLAFGAGYLLFVTATSVVATAFVVNLGALGVVVGALASAPVALALTFATTEFVADLVDDPALFDPHDRADSRGAT